jgi:hypothetical protein
LDGVVIAVMASFYIISAITATLSIQKRNLSAAVHAFPPAGLAFYRQVFSKNSAFLNETPINP